MPITPDMKTVLSAVAVLAALLLLAACFPSVVMRNRAMSSTAEFTEAFEADSEMVFRSSEELEETVREMEADGLVSALRSTDMSIEERDRLYDLWSAYLDSMLVLQQVSRRYSEFRHMEDRAERHRAFSLAFAALMARQYWGYRLVSMTIGNDLYEKKLDDRNDERGLPAGLYANLKWHTIHVEKVTLISAGRYYFKRVRRDMKKTGLDSDKTVNSLHRLTEEHYRHVKETLRTDGPGYFGSNGLDIISDGLGKAWLPLQREVASFMGDVRFRDKRRHLISLDQVREMERVLEPGDIIVERRNWYLSNVGLPGFWPHAELYVGDMDKLESYFDVPEVKEHFRGLGDYDGFTDYLNRTYPDRMALMASEAKDGNPRRVIEAVGEGVSMTSLEEAAHADYIGVMRPMLGRLDKALAIEQAIRYVGRAYDFDFDFLTDSTLVCSELVYKSYMPGKGKKGLHFTLEEVLGRKVISPNSMVRKFDLELGGARQELEFVYYLEGSEGDRTALVRGPGEFRRSHLKSKWDVAQK